MMDLSRHILWPTGVLLCLFLLANANKVEKASDHDHWEHIVKRESLMSYYNSRLEEDDTAHIVNVQDYYRTVFDEGFDRYRDNEKELSNILNNLESVNQNRGKLQNNKAQENLADILKFGIYTKPIPGRYIVMFQSSSDDAILDKIMAVLERAHRDSEKRMRVSDMQALRFVGKGFTATMNSLARNMVAKHPLLQHIEEDTAIRRSEVMIHKDRVAVKSDSIPWNLDRIDQRNNQLNDVYNPIGKGENVDIHIIDTGIMAEHEEFEGRARDSGYDAVDDLTGSSNHGRDCDGHGTHCSGTAAGKTYGSAKKANIVSTRALDCEGSGAVSGIVTGMDKIIQAHKESITGRPIVISQSIEVRKSKSLNRAIREALNAGILVVGAAGNQGYDSCFYSPPSARVGLSVGATDWNDEVADFTNTGECTDIMAPGYMIESASIECDTCISTLSGTSMATPLVAGVAAIILGKNPKLSGKEVKKKIIADSTKGKVTMSYVPDELFYETPNRLVFIRSRRRPRRRPRRRYGTAAAEDDI